ncbi:MAG: hypothetical protein H7A21_04840 [Spirochaetales bacterium]|nr:hypothetical protein [Leptospiraceae bacterium]MCP5480740.1 hypothetical protein [Spirochaetales bacterium]MCP5484092.1 hypothetical protein [Spirochaetales bacterium]
MENSLLFRVRPDGNGARWTNLARVIGLVGIVLVLVAKLLEGSVETLATILYVPGALLCLANLVWIYLLPSIVMLAYYTAAFAVISLVNLLHVIILQKNNDELVYFLAKFMNMRARVALCVLGVTANVPHVDVYGSDTNSKVIGLRFQTQDEMPVRWLLLRLALLAAVGLLAGVLALGVQHIPYFGMALGILFGVIAILLGLSLIVLWVHNAITGRFIMPLVDLHLRLLRVELVLSSYFTFVTNEVREFRSCFRSVLNESIASGLSAPEWINPNDARRLDINLIALVVLIVATSGLYLFVWLARTARVMGDDAFTIIAVTALGSLLPLSVIFSRYYRRLEKKTGNDPSWVLELLMVIPIVNLIVGTFTIQYIFNLTKKTRTAS